MNDLIGNAQVLNMDAGNNLESSTNFGATVGCNVTLPQGVPINFCIASFADE